MSTVPLTDLQRTDWQTYVNELLSIHFVRIGKRYQRIPDKVNGDHGLEGFSNCGSAFQAYADEDSANEAERTKKQKRKISIDLKKLVTYQAWWTEVFKDLKLVSWTLVVPKLCDREVVRHVRTETRKILSHNLPFLDNAFEGFVTCPKDYPQALAQMSATYIDRLETGNITEKDFVAVEESKPDFIAKIERKTRRLIPPGANDLQLKNQVKRFLEAYLKTENMLQDLLEKYPSDWEDVDALTNAQAQSIETEALITTLSPNERWNEAKKEFTAALQQTAKFLSPADVTILATGVVSRWLGECNLDFPEIGPTHG